MAKVIAEAYTRVASGSAASGPALSALVPVEELVSAGESSDTEFKSTLRTNLHTGQSDPRIEHAALKTIAAFVNSNGGTLIIGVSDDGTPVGIDADKFPNEDKMYLHLVNLIRDRIGPQHMMFIHPRFDDFEDVRVLIVGCQKGRAPLYVREGGTERFYIRTGAATTELSASQMHQYISHRFE